MQTKVFPILLCREGFILDQDVSASNGALLANRGSRLSATLIIKLKEMGIQSVQIKGDFTPEELEALKISEVEEQNKIYIEEYKEDIKGLHEVMDEITEGKELKVEKVTKMIDGFIQKGPASFSILKCINEMRSFDEYTYTHSINVSIYAMLLAKCEKLSDTQVEHVMQAGILHDIGKAKIPNEILNKPAPLDDEEFEIMKTHSTLSYRLIENAPDIDPNVKKAVLMHHEKEDGRGYPLGASGSKIHLYGRILAIADVYDALTSVRVYKKGLTPFQAFKIFEQMGIGHFDFNMMNGFMYNVACFYVGAKALLSDGRECEIVFIPPTSIPRPTVKISNTFLDLNRFPDLEIIQIF